MKSLFQRNKKSKSLPPDCVCRNCKTELIGEYCHNCGQSFFSGSERTVSEIVYSAVDTVFAWDNKIFTTLKYLVFYPGKLTKEFFEGRIIQYVFPAKLFWFIIILFFAILNIGDEMNDSSTNSGKNIEVNIGAKKKADATISPQTDISQKNEKDIEKDLLAKKKEVSSEKENVISSQIKQNLVGYIPYVVFLLVPFFALLLFMLFHKRKKYYANHMIFALHFHSFVFILFTVCVLVGKIAPASWEDAIDGVMFFLPAIYFAIALHVAYRPSIPKLLWKIPLIMIVYGIVCITVLILFILLIVRIAEAVNNVELF